ncbi:MAG TPA: DUF2844 domain-containing protein [Paraburkholderia sp.]|nr:DUF2844 domain-containing protein [Paraburkholderia sp.]
MQLLKFTFAAMSVLPLASYAALGGAPGAAGPASSQSQSLLRSVSPSVVSSNSPAGSLPVVTAYTVHETRGADGVTIREYASPANTVFAVSWQGPVRPEMNAVLGSYFPNFASAAAGRPRGTGPLVAHHTDFHIESAGRPGYFFGKAYVSRLVPAQVRVEDLQ